MPCGGNSKTPAVLIVEDELLVRLNAVRTIENAGFKVVEAANADEAIRILESRKDIRVIFTDINMPGSMDGLKLAAVVRNRWPPVQIVVMSGKRRPARDELPHRARFIEKPLHTSDLLKAIAIW